jgi:hypothetical protein
LPLLRLLLKELVMAWFRTLALLVPPQALRELRELRELRALLELRVLLELRALLELRVLRELRELLQVPPALQPTTDKLLSKPLASPLPTAKHPKERLVSKLLNKALRVLPDSRPLNKVNKLANSRVSRLVSRPNRVNRTASRLSRTASSQAMAPLPDNRLKARLKMVLTSSNRLATAPLLDNNLRDRMRVRHLAATAATEPRAATTTTKHCAYEFMKRTSLMACKARAMCWSLANQSFLYIKIRSDV